MLPEKQSSIRASKSFVSVVSERRWRISCSRKRRYSVFHETHASEPVGRILQHHQAKSHVIIHSRAWNIPEEKVLEFLQLRHRHLFSWNELGIISPIQKRSPLRQA